MKHTPNLEIDGTHFQNTLENVTYQSLTATFGEPEQLADEKVQVQWILQTPHGVGTIYDWKCYDMSPENITTWNIGGHNPETADYIIQYFHTGQ